MKNNLGGQYMINKKTIITLGLFLTICASLCVYADEGSDVGTFEELASIVSGDDKTGEIILTKNFVNTDGYDASGIKVTGHDLVIKGEPGKDITLDAKSAGRIFNANGTKNVRFENIRFVNGNAEGAGGAVILGDEASNKVVNCTFEGCSASEFGGALDGNAENSVFKNCNSTHHGGAIFDGYATNCEFEKCFSTSQGGAISYHNASNCTFTNCYAWWQGGALYHADAVGCKFINCYASEGGSMYEGSAFDCQFENSVAKNGSGGAAYNVVASGCKFSGCSVTGGEGSAMYGGSATNCEMGADEAVNVTMK